MKARRPWLPIVVLFLFAGTVGFCLGIAVTRPAAVRGDEATRSSQEANAPRSPASGKVQRFGSMIGLRPEKKEEYIRLHAHCWPEILAILKKCHIQNYSIYLGEIDGKLYLFSYFEYTGDDVAKDTAVMKADPKTREWWTHTDPCQIRLPNTKQGDWWKGIPEVFHMD
jgi:L-rhamnose mutarotase